MLCKNYGVLFGRYKYISFRVRNIVTSGETILSAFHIYNYAVKVVPHRSEYDWLLRTT